MTFVAFLKSGDKTLAWDSKGRAWRENTQYIEGGHVDGGAYTAYALKHNFRCECKVYGPAGSTCECGQVLPPAWVRESLLDHPDCLSEY